MGGQAEVAEVQLRTKEIIFIDDDDDDLYRIKETKLLCIYKQSPPLPHSNTLNFCYLKYLV